jgi:hypothetical protein
MKHGPPVITYIVIARKDRDGASSTLSDESEKCVQDRHGCSAAPRLNDEVSFGNVAQKGLVESLVRLT